MITLGFAIYSFEGIGIVMPVMHACEKPEQFYTIFVCAIATLTVIMIAFSELCYFTWGSNLTEPIITEMLPRDSTVAIITKLFYIVNCMCSFSIII